MSRFKRCANTVHATLVAAVPRIKLSQSKELLAAALGHGTLATFNQVDAEAFEVGTAFAILDPEATMLRALDMGYELNRDHWSLLKDELMERQVVGAVELLDHVSTMAWKARYSFYDLVDPRLDALIRPHGTDERYRQILHESLKLAPLALEDDAPPSSVWSTIIGEVIVETPKRNSFAVPVETKFLYRRTGQRLYAPPVLNSIQMAGDVRQYCVSEDIGDY